MELKVTFGQPGNWGWGSRPTVGCMCSTVGREPSASTALNPAASCLRVTEFKPNCTLTDVENARTSATRAIRNSESSWHSH